MLLKSDFATSDALKKAVGLFDSDRKITAATNIVTACDKTFDEILKRSELINMQLLEVRLRDILPKFGEKSA